MRVKSRVTEWTVDWVLYDIICSTSVELHLLVYCVRFEERKNVGAGKKEAAVKCRIRALSSETNGGNRKQSLAEQCNAAERYTRTLLLGFNSINVTMQQCMGAKIGEKWLLHF